MRRTFFFLAILITSLILGQDYAWPTYTSKQLTSNFGEFRDKHFHMGLDIRTNGSVGHPLYAIHDGYLYRIATNFNGYGKALYLKTNDGKIAVYGHLSRFSSRFENRLFELQNENQSYFVNKYFQRNEYPVARGEIIGFSGNSGGSEGPHLHFELRNDQDQPLNPITSGFPLVDNVPPKFINISLIPLSYGTHIDSFPLPQTHLPINLSPGEYILKDTISVTGKFGITSLVIDEIQNTSHSYQINKIDLLVNSISVFSVQYNFLDFSEGENITTVYGQPINHPEHDNFQKLYRLEPYPKLTIHSDDKTGIIDLADGIHKIEILAWDAGGGKSTLTFYVRSINFLKKTIYETFLNLNEYPTVKNKSEVFIPEITQLENGAIFQLQININSLDTIKAFIEKPDVIMTFPLIKVDGDQYVSEMINPYLFKDSKSCGFLFYSNIIQKYEFDFTPKLILPNSAHKIISSDSLSFIEINNAIYDTTLMWIAKETFMQYKNSVNQKSNIYELHPYGIPFKNDVSVLLVINDDISLKHCAIYTYNTKKSKWDFVESNIDTFNNFITAKLSQPVLFTVLEDNKPPVVLYTYPKNQQTYSIDTVKKFIITLDDDLSSFNPSEEYLRVFLDGKRIWVAYQPVKRELSYYLRNPLSKGEHDLLIIFEDRSGNSASKTIKFSVE